MKITKILTIFLFSLMALTFFGVKDANAAARKMTKSKGWNQSLIKWVGVAGADHYNIYFREGNQTKYIGAVRDIRGMSGWNMQWINHLRPGVKYFYRIAAVDGSGKEFSWSQEKMMVVSPMSKMMTEESNEPMGASW